MKAKFFGALLAAPLAAASAMIMAAPASAAVFFNNGDLLNFTGGFKAPAATGVYKFIEANGSAADVGSYGNFGILAAPSSSGAFAPFSSGGSVVAGNKILSVDFTNPATYLNKDFLLVTKASESFKFVITDPITQLFAGGNAYAATFKGLFKSADDEVLGEGILTSNFRPKKNGSYSVTLEVTKTVPEPSALLGLGLMVGTIFIIRRSQEVSA